MTYTNVASEAIRSTPGAHAPCAPSFLGPRVDAAQVERMREHRAALHHKTLLFPARCALPFTPLAPVTWEDSGILSTHTRTHDCAQSLTRGLTPTPPDCQTNADRNLPQPSALVLSCSSNSNNISRAHPHPLMSGNCCHWLPGAYELPACRSPGSGRDAGGFRARVGTRVRRFHCSSHRHHQPRHRHHLHHHRHSNQG